MLKIKYGNEPRIVGVWMDGASDGLKVTYTFDSGLIPFNEPKVLLSSHLEPTNVRWIGNEGDCWRSVWQVEIGLRSQQSI